MKINNLQGGYSKWNTVILSDEHSSAGSASYSEKPSPELLIKLGSNELRAEVTQGDFANGGGTIFYNGERIGNWFGKIPGRLTVMDTRRITILRLEEDDWSRRFKWAYHNGLSWRQAWRYASWGYLLIGKNYALASIIDPISIGNSPLRTLHSMKRIIRWCVPCLHRNNCWFSLSSCGDSAVFFVGTSKEGLETPVQTFAPSSE